MVGDECSSIVSAEASRYEDIYMHKLKLDYFDFNGGRGEVARLAMALGEVPIEDHRIPVADWLSVRNRTPFHAVPAFKSMASRSHSPMPSIDSWVDWRTSTRRTRCRPRVVMR